MVAGKKYFIYQSTMRKYSDFVDFLQRENGADYVDMFMMLYNAFGIGTLLDSPYFEILRIGDGKYELTVQKYVNETYSIKLVINTNYENGAERFTTVD